MRKKPRILNRETVARSRLFHIEALDLEFSNGATARYERLRGSSRRTVLIVPLLDADTVLLVREYAAGTERYELGLPKGRVEPDEPLLEAANRELMEEAGYGARRLEQITSLTLAPGFLGHSTCIILARDLYPQRLPGDEPEVPEVVPWRMDRIGQLWRDGECSEARTIASLFIAREHMDCG
ncbi:MAG TPA: ADP compounds hydrolase NudE [Gammaproteobacteria bacterium]|nr:ADP compounds hydrolase NudE [Gammaproteobacteria bacterium]